MVYCTSQLKILSDHANHSKNLACHCSLDDLEKFIAYATKELTVELAEDDYEGLLRVMGVLNEVRAKADAGAEMMFEPLRDIIYVLKEYGVEFPEETYEQVFNRNHFSCFYDDRNYNILKGGRNSSKPKY